MKKKIILMSVAGILALTAVIGGTLAGFQTQSEQGKTDITTKALGIELIDDNTIPLADTVMETTVHLPGDTVEMPYFVTNDVEEGYELYTRITIYKYWEEQTNEALDPEKVKLYAGTGDNAVELVAGNQVNNWFVQYSDAEQIILYYAKPLASGVSTEHVLDSLTVAPEIGNEYTDKNFIVAVKADAVQRKSAEASIPAEWGVYPTFDADGNITAIAE